MKRSGLKRKTALTPKRSRRNWTKMSEGTWQAAEGRCEICGHHVPHGTPYAHIIPRSDTKNTSDGPGNGACLCLIRSDSDAPCHARLDENRGKAYADMKAGPGCVLLDRIQADPRLREYFEKRELRYRYVQETE